MKQKITTAVMVAGCVVILAVICAQGSSIDNEADVFYRQAETAFQKPQMSGSDHLIVAKALHAYLQLERTKLPSETVQNLEKCRQYSELHILHAFRVWDELLKTGTVTEIKISYLSGGKSDDPTQTKIKKSRQIAPQTLTVPFGPRPSLPKKEMDQSYVMMKHLQPQKVTMTQAKSARKDAQQTPPQQTAIAKELETYRQQLQAAQNEVRRLTEENNSLKEQLEQLRQSSRRSRRPTRSE